MFKFKRYLIGLILCIIPGRTFEIQPTQQQRINISNTIQFEILIKAIAYTESRFNPDTVNHSSNAVGMYQIRPIMVKECNRIKQKVVFHDSMRFNPDISKEMLITCFNYHCKGWMADKGLWKKACLIWHCGNGSSKSKAGEIYWKTVLKHAKLFGYKD